MARRRFNEVPRERPTDEDWYLDKGTPLWPSRGDENDVIALAVESLDEPYRSVLEMRFWGRMTYAAIAQEMGWKGRQWTSTYLRRGMKRLREKLEELSQE